MKALYMFLLSVVCYGNMKDNVDLGGSARQNTIQSIQGFLWGKKIDQENKNSILSTVSIHHPYLHKIVCVLK